VKLIKKVGGIQFENKCYIYGLIIGPLMKSKHILFNILREKYIHDIVEQIYIHVTMPNNMVTTSGN